MLPDVSTSVHLFSSRDNLFLHFVEVQENWSRSSNSYNFPSNFEHFSEILVLFCWFDLLSSIYRSQTSAIFRDTRHIIILRWKRLIHYMLEIWNVLFIRLPISMQSELERERQHETHNKELIQTLFIFIFIRGILSWAKRRKATKDFGSCNDSERNEICIFVILMQSKYYTKSLDGL